MAAGYMLLGIRGHIPMPGVQGGRDPELEKHLRRFLSLPGRPSAAIVHAEWAARFLALRDDLNGDRFERVDNERLLGNLELCQLIVDELGLTVTSRAVWDAVKRLI